MDTLYRTSIISSSIVVLLNPLRQIYLWLLSLSILDLWSRPWVWPDCWVSAEFLRAPIPRKGSGSTTTHSHQPMPIYFGMRVIITENHANLFRDKAGEFFNGNLGCSFPFKSHSFCSLQSLTDCHLSSNQSTKRHLLSNSTSLFRDRGKSARTNHSTRYNLV